jgi:hypothetical protein
MGSKDVSKDLKSIFCPAFADKCPRRFLKIRRLYDEPSSNPEPFIPLDEETHCRSTVKMLEDMMQPDFYDRVGGIRKFSDICVYVGF